MKITLKDFGPISHFEFDLEKDLHVIFGKNNIGKSYAITAVYLILKNLIIEGQNNQNVKLMAFNESNIDEKIKNQTDTPSNISIYISEILGGIIDGYFRINLSSSINNSFASISKLSNKRTSNRLQIILTFDYLEVELVTNDQFEAFFIQKTTILSHVYLTKLQNDLEGKRYLLRCGEYSFREARNFECINKLFEQLFLTEIKNIQKVYFFPTSRAGLYQVLSNFGVIFAELSKNRNSLSTKTFEFPNITEPIADYFSEISSINSTTKLGLKEFANLIEQDILNGTVHFNDDNKKLYYKPNEVDIELDLSFTSSMVAELLPIVALLKFAITKDGGERQSILFIEEPEVHLHPEIQVKLMELFATLAGKGVKIVMTSHSNYMFNKLSNLLLEGKIDHNKVGSYLMKQTSVGSITDTLSMKAEIDGMNDENFADVAEMLYEERIKTYDQLNKTAHHAD